MIFCSTMVYSLGKHLGFDHAVAEVHRQLQQPGPDSLPVVRAIARLQTLDDVELMIDPAATSIAKARCRAFHAAALSRADVWVMVDDDCEATADTFDLLLQAARLGGDLVLAPCLLRGQERSNVSLFQVSEPRVLPDGARVLRAHAGGLAIAALSRHAMNELVDAYDDALRYRDHDGVQRLALFHEGIAGGHWFGEDVAFCARVTAAGLAVEALGTGVTMHAGQGLLLAELDLYPGLDFEPATEFRIRKPYTAPTVTDVEP